MGYLTRQPPGWRAVLAVAARQFGVITHRQLLELGLSAQSVKHRVGRGKLHRLYRGVYAVGRRELDRDGQRMAAILACRPGAAVSHSGATEFWQVGKAEAGLEITVCPPRTINQPRLRIHRSRTLTASEIITVQGIAVTDPLRTLVDMAPRWRDGELDDAIERMAQKNLRSPEQLLHQLNQRATIPGSGIVREALTHWTLTLTDTQLERRVLPIASRAGLPHPLTQQVVNGHRVDFFWPTLGLVVEADSLRYHRTAAKQAADARRDQDHAAAGLTPLRFSHAQITYQPATVERTLRKVATRLARAVSTSAAAVAVPQAGGRRRRR
jgi:very-short-patch-repair endonuclease/predicted transcriptional regulator of viral defense system